MLQKVNNQKGFTLVEVMLVIAIIAIAIILLSTLMGSMNVEKKDLMMKYEERKSYGLMMDEMLHELKYAKNVTVQNGDEVEILNYETQKGEKNSIIFRSGKMYNKVDGKEYYIAQVEKTDGEVNRVEYEEGAVKFNVQLINLKAKMDFKVVLRYE